MAQDKVIIRRSGHQQLDELDATDIPALDYAASNAYVPGGTDVPVTDGGTGASDAATARSNLGALSQAQVLARGLGS